MDMSYILLKARNSLCSIIYVTLGPIELALNTALLSTDILPKLLEFFSFNCLSGGSLLAVESRGKRMRDSSSGSKLISRVNGILVEGVCWSAE